MDEDEASQGVQAASQELHEVLCLCCSGGTLNDPWLEKLYVYLSWLNKLLPSRAGPGEINITDDMLTLSAFKLEQQESGSASLGSGETTELKPITEFGANPYTEEEEQSLSEIIESFNDRHGAKFTEDFLRFEQVQEMFWTRIC